VHSKVQSPKPKWSKRPNGPNFLKLHNFKIKNFINKNLKNSKISKIQNFEKLKNFKNLKI
jgi:hypothetical protein